MIKKNTIGFYYVTYNLFSYILIYLFYWFEYNLFCRGVKVRQHRDCHCLNILLTDLRRPLDFTIIFWSRVSQLLSDVIIDVIPPYLSIVITFSKRGSFLWRCNFKIVRSGTIVRNAPSKSTYDSVGEASHNKKYILLVVLGQRKLIRFSN